MTDDPRAEKRPSRERLVLAALLLAVFGAMLFAKALAGGGLEQTAMFYVGIPALIAVTVVLTARPRSAVGLTLAVTTIGLALAGPLLDEGVVCLVMAAPLIYGVAALIAWLVSLLVRPGQRHHQALVAAPLLAAALIEGVAGVSYLPRDSAASATVMVDASPEAYAAALAAPPAYGPFEAVLLKTVPFPHPVSATGSGLEVGDRRVVRFNDRKSLGLGAEPTPRSMTLRVAESDIDTDAGRVVFEVTADSTLSRWMELQSATVAWHRVGDRTETTWTLDWARTYDPSWYFGPLQQHTTGLAVGYLADTFAAAAANS
ncbi:hypothetical protein ACFWQC_01885 [Nocardioides sp. NPDC058538]|uniref:hypothetical protein n=1 Tax=Nocardioides sp. NPDC058538 TaxID=3346542 RepID=UPI003649741F